MAQFTKRCYPTFPEAARLAALTGAKDDIDQVINYCYELEKQIAANYRSYYLWEAIANAAAVAYARCFISGVRPPLPTALLSSAPQHIRETHEFIMELRNKHIAHSVNVFEDNRVIANVLVTDLEPTMIESVEVESHRFMAVSDEEVRHIREAAEWWKTQTESFIETERSKVLQQFRERPIDSIMEFSQEPFPPFLAEGSISKARKQQ